MGVWHLSPRPRACLAGISLPHRGGGRLRGNGWLLVALILVTALMWLWPAEVAVMVIPPGMLGVLSGSIDDGWGGMLGWMWLACTITTIVLVVVTRAALRERYYSAVMAATGFLYLAILTGFGMDIVPRAVLAP